MRQLVVVFSLLVLVCAMLAPEMLAGPGSVDGKHPISVGKATGENGNDGTKVRGMPAASGQISGDYRNDSGMAATDVHVRVVSPVNAEIDSITTAEIDDDTSHMTQDASPALPNTEAGASCGAGESLAQGKQLKVTVKLRYKQGTINGGQLVTDQEVELEVYWTQAGDAICCTSTDDIGSARPATGLASVVPDYNPTPVAVDSDDMVTLNDICLAERDGYRFRRGSLVFTPGSRTSFAMNGDTRVEVYDEDGDDVPADIVAISELRVDDRGNFVFDIVRGASEKHVVLVIRGLILTNVHHENGEEVWCSASGAAISGGVLQDNWKIANVSQEE